jgi:hypothetical protein
MNTTWKKNLLSVLSVILIGWGIVFAFWGFGFFVDIGLLPAKNLLAWESGLYGAIMMGWGLTLFLLGRIAFQRDDPELRRVMLVGIALWLIVEAFFSFSLGVWFNVGVDFAVFALFALVLSQQGNKKS